MSDYLAVTPNTKSRSSATVISRTENRELEGYKQTRSSELSTRSPVRWLVNNGWYIKKEMMMIGISFFSYLSTPAVKSDSDFHCAL